MSHDDDSFVYLFLFTFHMQVRDGVKFVPLFYFEGETEHLKLKSDQVEGWDLAYLKFCCKVQGIRNELFAAEVCRVVALDEIKGHFPSGTTFEVSSSVHIYIGCAVQNFMLRCTKGLLKSTRLKYVRRLRYSVQNR